MFLSGTSTGLQKTTSYKVVLPFYLFAAFSFLVACTLLLANTNIATQHHFHPKTLAITHLMALGWGTMIILGASHQLLPVLIEGKLWSNTLAYLSFVFAAAGIPLLVSGFYFFAVGWPLQLGAVLVNIALLCYAANVIGSLVQTKKLDVYALFMLTATLWLLATVIFGLLLVFNFTRSWLPQSSVEYLSLHAHMGLAGWFLLLIIGVASRLIPMFLISKYTNTKTLWTVFSLINLALVAFIVIRLAGIAAPVFYAPFLLVLAALLLFGQYLFKAYKARIRRQVDEQMKLSLLSILLLLLPMLTLVLIIYFVSRNATTPLVLLYGFCLFFGWITAIIFGMTFKTLPFIVWNKVYATRALGATPAPKDLFSASLFNATSVCYLAGFFLFAGGIILSLTLLLKGGGLLLLAAAVLYLVNVLKTILHQPKNHERRNKQYH